MDTTVEVLEKLRTACEVLGVSLEDALVEKTSELSLRVFLRCIPNEYIKPDRIAEFVTEVLRAKPAPELLDAVTRTRRGPSLTDDEYIALEQMQLSRCALCGAVLTPSAKPHVDHIVPVALGGKSVFENYQLLCQRCNQGKSKLIGWVMGAPFLDEGETLRLRYCVLTRDRATCSIADCGLSSRHAEIEPQPIIPVQRGGRWIFDNLRSMCSHHAQEERRKWKTQAFLAVRTVSTTSSSARWGVRLRQ